MALFSYIGSYILLLLSVLRKPEKWSVFRKQFFSEVQHFGIDSLGIVAVISVFMGAIVTIQTAYNIDSPLIPASMIGFTARQSVILEFSPTVISLILAGKVGSRIASEIGTMRVTEQIDALEIMGINPASYLILPKIVALVFINPILIVFSVFFSLAGGYLVAMLTSLFSPEDYILGIRFAFEGYTVFYMLIKTAVFAFIIGSVSGYSGFLVKGGALEVGAASTKAVVHSSIWIILFNLILTQLLLS